MKIEISGPPVSWKRARRCGNRYFDAQAPEKQMVQLQAKFQLKSHKPFLSPVRAHILFEMPIPSSWSKKRQTAALKTPHSTLPDLDNLIKFVLDALNGVVWKDDSLIYEINATKKYGDVAKTTLWINQNPPK